MRWFLELLCFVFFFRCFIVFILSVRSSRVVRRRKIARSRGSGILVWSVNSSIFTFCRFLAVVRCFLVRVLIYVRLVGSINKGGM